MWFAPLSSGAINECDLMLISYLIDIVRQDYLKDNTEPYLWPDAELLRKFTEAERQVCNRANLLYEIYTITLVSGTRSYQLDPKITVIDKILFDGAYVDKNNKDHLDIYIPTWRTDTGMTGKNVYAVITGRAINISPIPDAADNGKSLTLECYRLPENSFTSINQSPEIPEENHHDLIYWVLHECYKKQDSDSFNQEKADYYLSRFNEAFGSYVSAKVRAHQLEESRQLIIRPSSSLMSSAQLDNW